MVEPYKQYVTKEKHKMEEDDEDFDEVLKFYFFHYVVHFSYNDMEILLQLFSTLL